MNPEQIEAMQAGRKNAVKTPRQNAISEEIRLSIQSEIEQRLKEVSRHSPSALGIFKRCYEGGSRTAAIKAKCLDCCCWQRVEVTNCQSFACPLWLYRPYQP